MKNVTLENCQCICQETTTQIIEKSSNFSEQKTAILITLGVLISLLLIIGVLITINSPEVKERRKRKNE